MASNPLLKYQIGANRWDSNYYPWNSGQYSTWATQVYPAQPYGQYIYFTDRSRFIQNGFYYRVRETTNPNLQFVPTDSGRSSPYNLVPVVGGIFTGTSSKFAGAYTWSATPYINATEPAQIYDDWTVSFWLKKPSSLYPRVGQGGSSKLVTIYAINSSTLANVIRPFVQINNISGTNPQVTINYFSNNNNQIFTENYSGQILTDNWNNIVISLKKNIATYTLNIYLNAVLIYQKTLNGTNGTIFYPNPQYQSVYRIEFGADNNGEIPSNKNLITQVIDSYLVDELAVYKEAVIDVGWLSWATTNNNYQSILEIYASKYVSYSFINTLGGNAEVDRNIQSYKHIGAGNFSVGNISAITKLVTLYNHGYSFNNFVTGTDSFNYFPDLVLQNSLNLKYFYRQYTNAIRLPILVTGTSANLNAGVIGVRANNSTAPPNNWQWNSASVNGLSLNRFFYTRNTSWAVSFWIKKIETASVPSSGGNYDCVMNVFNKFLITFGTDGKLWLYFYNYIPSINQNIGPQQAAYTGSIEGPYKIDISVNDYTYIAFGWDGPTTGGLGNTYVFSNNNYSFVGIQSYTFESYGLTLGFNEFSTSTGYGPPACAIQNLLFFHKGLNLSANPFDARFCSNNICYNVFPPLGIYLDYNQTRQYKYVFKAFPTEYIGNSFTGSAQCLYTRNDRLNYNPVVKYTFDESTSQDSADGFKQYNFKETVSGQYTSNLPTTPASYYYSLINNSDFGNAYEWMLKYFKWGSYSYSNNLTQYPVLAAGKIGQKSVVVGESLYLYDNASAPSKRTYKSNFKSSFSFPLDKLSNYSNNWTYGFWIKSLSTTYGGTPTANNYLIHNGYFTQTLGLTSDTSVCQKSSILQIFYNNSFQFFLHRGSFYWNSQSSLSSNVVNNLINNNLTDSLIFVSNDFSDYNNVSNNVSGKLKNPLKCIKGSTGTGVNINLFNGNWNYLTIVCDYDRSYSEYAYDIYNRPFLVYYIPFVFYINGVLATEFFAPLPASIANSNILIPSAIFHGIARENSFYYSSSNGNTTYIDFASQYWKSSNQNFNEQIAPFSLPYAIDQPVFYNKAFTANEAKSLFNNDLKIKYYYTGIGSYSVIASNTARTETFQRTGSGIFQIQANASVVFKSSVISFVGNGIFTIISNGIVKRPYPVPTHKYTFGTDTQVSSLEYGDLVGNNNFEIVNTLFVNENSNIVTTGINGQAIMLGSKYQLKINTNGNAWYAAGKISNLSWGTTNQFTISFWIKPDNTLTNNFSQGFWLRMYNASNLDSTISFRFGNFAKFFSQNPSTILPVSFVPNFNPYNYYNWQNIVIVYIPTFIQNLYSGYGAYYIYVNGSLFNAVTNYGAFRSPLNDTIEFGGGGEDVNKPDELIPRRFALDELQIYDRGLDAIEVYNVYAGKIGPLKVGGQLSGFSGAASYFTGGRVTGQGSFDLQSQNEIYITKALVISQVGIVVDGAEAPSYVNIYVYSGDGSFQFSGLAASGVNKWITEGGGTFQCVANAVAAIKQYRYPASGGFEVYASNMASREKDEVYPVHKYLFNNLQLQPNYLSNYFYVDDLVGNDKLNFTWTYESSFNKTGMSVNFLNDQNILTVGKFSLTTVQVGSLTQNSIGYTGNINNRYETYKPYYTGTLKSNKSIIDLINNSNGFSVSFWGKINTIPIIPGANDENSFYKIGYLYTYTSNPISALPFINKNSTYNLDSEQRISPFVDPRNLEWSHYCYVCNSQKFDTDDGKIYIYVYLNGTYYNKFQVYFESVGQYFSGLFSIGEATETQVGNLYNPNGNSTPLYENIASAAFSVDDVRIYNKPLSISNIQDIYNNIYYITGVGSFQNAGTVQLTYLPNEFKGTGTFQVSGYGLLLKSMWDYSGSGNLQVLASHLFNLPYEYPIHQYIFDTNYGFLKDSVGSCDINLSILGSSADQNYIGYGITGNSFNIGTTGYFDSFGYYEYYIAGEIYESFGNTFLPYNSQFSISFWLSPSITDHGSYQADEFIVQHYGQSESVFIQDVQTVGLKFIFYYTVDGSEQKSTYVNIYFYSTSLITLTFDQSVSYGDEQYGEWNLYINSGQTENVDKFVIRTDESNAVFNNPTGLTAKTIFGRGISKPSILRSIDDLRYYDRALTQNEIENNYNFIFGPVVGDPDFQMTGTAPAIFGYAETGSGNFENSGEATYLANAYVYLSSGSFQVQAQAEVSKNFYYYTGDGLTQAIVDAVCLADAYVYEGTGQFENTGEAYCAQSICEFTGTGTYQVEANAEVVFEIKVTASGQFEISGTTSEYVIYNNYQTTGQVELASSSRAIIRFAAVGSGSYQLEVDADPVPIPGSLWERTQHLYQFKNNMFDGRGNFDIIFNGSFGTSAEMPYYGYSVGTYPFVGNGTQDDAFFTEDERFALTFRFLITDVNFNKSLISLNSNYPIATTIPSSIDIVYQSSDQSIRYGIGGTLLSDIFVEANTWYFVAIYKRGQKLYSSINAGIRLNTTYDYNTINFYGIQSQNSLVSGDSNLLYLSDIRFYKNMITQAEITYLYNNGIPTGITPIDVPAEYNDPSHSYDFEFSERVSVCCFDLLDGVGSNTIVLDCPQPSFEPYIDGIDGNAIRLGSNYLNQGGFYSYDAYGYSYNNFVGAGSYSVAFWHKMLGPSVGSVDPVTNLPFSETVSITTSSGEVIFSIKESNGVLSFSLENTFLDPEDYVLASGPDTQSWNHIAISVNTDQGRAYIYFNAQLVRAFEYDRVLTDPAALFLGYNAYFNAFAMKAMSLATQSYCELQAIDNLLFFAAPVTGWDIATLFGCGENANIELTLDLPFDTGNLPVYQWRFESNCNGYDADGKIVPSQTLGQDCNYTIFNTTGAPTLTQACQQMLDAGYDFEVTSIQRWSKPTVLTSNSFEDGKYEDIIGYCNDPACFNFCVNYRVDVQIAAIMLAITGNDEITGSGRCELTGVAGIKFNKFTDIGSGQIQANGSSPASQVGGIQGLVFTASGGPEVYGSASYDSSDKGIINTEIGSDMLIVDLQPFVVTRSGSALTGSQGISTVNTCSCISIPYEINFIHNLKSRESELTRFVNRNNFTLPDRIILYYNDYAGKYVGNLKYKGLSTTSNNLENWSITFELGCTGYRNSFNGVYDWNLSITFKKSPAIGNGLDTKIVELLKSNYVCPINGISFSFTTNADLKTKQLTVNSNTFLANSVIINDRIGLFNSPAWLNNPVLSLQIGLPQ